MESSVFVTGGTGMIGGELCKRLLARQNCQIYVLTRKPISTISDSLAGAILIEGDLAAPRFGFPSDTYHTLQESVTDIVHCAADTHFGLPLEVIRIPNVTGTTNVLEFARVCRRLDKFFHVSTAYVAGRLAGRISEEQNRHQEGFFNTYQQSKFEAEGLVFDVLDRLPVAVVRLSSVIGDSRTGRVTAFNYVHRLLRLFPRNVLPIVPGISDAPVDLIPTEWAADALLHILDSAFRPGEIFHLCAGPAKSLTVRELFDVAFAQFENNPAGRTWLPIELPKLVSLAEFEAFAAESRTRTTSC